MKFNTGPEMVDVDGAIVEKDALRIAEAIKAYDPNLELLCLDPARADGVSDEPFVLVEKCKDGQMRKIKSYWQLDDRILADVEAADCQRHDLIAVINGRNERVHRERDRRYQELKEERMEIVQHIAGMKSSTVTTDPLTGEKIKFYDDRPAIRGEDNFKGKRSF